MGVLKKNIMKKTNLKCLFFGHKYKFYSLFHRGGVTTLKCINCGKIIKKDNNKSIKNMV